MSFPRIPPYPMTTNPQLVSPKDLPALLAEGGDATVIDVRSADDYESSHLPDAVHNCVYEVDFLERMPSLVSSPSRRVCVYGHGADTHEARVAAEKLTRAGYEKVLELRAGLAGWEQAGLPIEGPSKSAPPAPPELHGTREVDLTESHVKWTGRNLLNHHRGSVALKSGSLEFDHGALVGGNFTIDMNSIDCETLRGDPLRDALVKHLHSDDFFDTEIYPETIFQLFSATPWPTRLPARPT